MPLKSSLIEVTEDTPNYVKPDKRVLESKERWSLIISGTNTHEYDLCQTQIGWCRQKFPRKYQNIAL